MKRKLAVFFLSAAIVCCGAAIISSCGWSSDDASNSGWSVQTAYAQAVDLGFEGTLEEFLALIEGEDGADGFDGVGIESATINDKGELVLTYTDGNTVNLGKVTGTDGQDGQNGTNGTDGEDGKDGVGIKSATINDKGELVLAYTDGTTVNLGKVTGSDGEDGKDGLNGADGVGISKIYIEEGHLFIQLTDKNVVDCGALPSGVPCVHSYGEWVTEQQPKCMSIGYRTRTCGFCGDTEYDFLEPVGHSYGAQTAFTAVDGGHSFYCSGCGSYVMQPHSPDKDGNCACDYGLEYALAEDGLLYIVTDIINFSGTTLEIPAMHNGMPVSDMQASLYENIKSIIVPETLKAISGNTQSIQKVYISDLPAWIWVDKTVNLAFSSSTEFYVNGELLTDYTIPEGTTRIGACSYFNYLSLESITIPASVTEIGEWAFNNCTSLKVVNFEEGSQLKNIGLQAFYSCAITEVTIPASVVTIENAAFQSCNLLESVNFEENSQLQIFSGFTSCDNLKKLVVPDGVTRITNISANKSLSEITIPQSVIQIGGMSGNISLKEIFIPKNVELIGGVAAFARCTSLETVTFEEGSKLQSIGEGAFMDCTALTSITIPANVTELGSYVFLGCTSLQNINYDEGCSLQFLGDGAFSGCSELAFLDIPESVIQIGSFCFDGCNATIKIIIPLSVTKIDENNFWPNTHIFYCGTMEQWVELTNNVFEAYKNIYYYSATQPTGEGRYWHYAEDGVTPQVW